jgi:hypothetical protein
MRPSRLYAKPMVAASVLALSPLLAGAQIIRDSAAATSSASPASASVDVRSAVRAQLDFERFRFDHLPLPLSEFRCDEQVGKACYWYNERALPLPPEPAVVRPRREQFIALLDTVAIRSPGDRWAAEQRVRYLVESGRADSALSAARQCRVDGWACAVLAGYSLHALGRYAAADSAYALALRRMSPTDRCDWRSVVLLIDDDAHQQYDRLPCGDPRRDAFEDRTWFFARTLYSFDGNDSRTEHYARKTMEMMLRDAPDMQMDMDVRQPLRFPTDAEGHLELMLRFGWPRAWGFSRTPRLGGRGQVVQGFFPHYEPAPAYRYVPPGSVLNDPALSDSSNWRLQLSPVIARYAPPYAMSLTPLEHQKAMFRRGDTALVVMAYDARVTKPLAGGKLTAALVVTPSEKPTDYGKIVHDAPETGVLMARAPWGPLLMSAEVYAPDKNAVARARYGMSPPTAVGARVTLSDQLFFKPYGTLPTSVEEVAPHALPTERLMANEKLGVYWESYGTDPAGEKMKVSLTVVKEVAEAGLFQRLTKSLKLVHEATPVVVSVEDLSALGKTVTARALALDISTLKKGSYIVQLEIEVAGQYVIRAEHRIEVIGP